MKLWWHGALILEGWLIWTFDDGRQVCEWENRCSIETQKQYRIEWSIKLNGSYVLSFTKILGKNMPIIFTLFNYRYQLGLGPSINLMPRNVLYKL